MEPLKIGFAIVYRNELNPLPKYKKWLYDFFNKKYEPLYDVWMEIKLPERYIDYFSLHDIISFNNINWTVTGIEKQKIKINVLKPIKHYSFKEDYLVVIGNSFSTQTGESKSKMK